jgi:hypothetical protein
VCGELSPTRASSWNPNSNTLEPDRLHHDRLSASVTDHPYSYVSLVSLRLHHRAEKIWCALQNVVTFLYFAFKFAHVWNCLTPGVSSYTSISQVVSQVLCEPSVGYSISLSEIVRFKIVGVMRGRRMWRWQCWAGAGRSCWLCNHRQQLTSIKLTAVKPWRDVGTARVLRTVNPNIYGWYFSSNALSFA